jgi:DNA-binding MarR family transcriptional regulator
MLLLRHGAVSQTEFGRFAGLEKSWVSRIVERYEEEGLVERQALASDRRCLQLRLTPAGVRKAQEIDGVLTAHAEAFFRTLPAASHDSLQAALAQIVEALHRTPPEGV